MHICMWLGVHVCHRHRDGAHSVGCEEGKKKKKTKGRETGDDITNQGCSLDTMKLHLSVHITLTVLFSTAEQAESRDPVWCQSEGKHPLFKSREERMYQVYRGRIIPLR